MWCRTSVASRWSRAYWKPARAGIGRRAAAGPGRSKLGRRAAQSPVIAGAAILHSTGPKAFPKLRDLIADTGVVAREPIPDTILLSGPRADFEAILGRWGEGLSGVERAEIRAAFVPAPEIEPADLMTALLALRPVDQMLAELGGGWLRTVLESRSLWMHFQPLIAIADGRTVAQECLMRARDGDRVRGAGEILNTADRLGLLYHLDQIARQEAVLQGQDLVRQGNLLFINFTPNAIYDPQHCLRTTLATCDRIGVPLDRLVFEVMETESIADLPHLKRILAEYRAHGAQVALDDLGSGYASLTYLAELRPDYVKLDQGLLRGAHEDRVRSVILKAVTDAAHEIGVQVVAEGVEIAEDLRFCLELDVDLAQGYFIARPSSPPSPVDPAALEIIAQR